MLTDRAASEVSPPSRSLTGPARPGPGARPARRTHGRSHCTADRIPNGETIMSFFSRLRDRTSNPSTRGRAQHRPAAPRFRPRLEALEDRCVPSTLKVTNLDDFGNPGSLRYEIAHARSGDTIIFDSNL